MKYNTFFLSNLILIRVFLIGVKIFKTNFQIGFRIYSSLWEPLQIFFVLKSKEFLNFSNKIVIVFSLLETTIHSIKFDVTKKHYNKFDLRKCYNKFIKIK